MTIENDVSLKDLSTFKIGGTAAHLARIKTREDLTAACQWAQENQVGIFVLGEGSNTVFSDEAHNLLILKIEIPGFEVVSDSSAATIYKVGAGEHWDDIVAKTVDLKLSGIECMSMIPGTVGAAPIQNIGAYGQEVADTIIEIEAYDLTTSSFATLSKDQCNFGYRDSIFKSSQRGRYIICSVTLQFTKEPPLPPTYDSLKQYLAGQQITQPTHEQIRQAVMAIRATKLPDPSVVPNVGSFFKNPIIEQSAVDELHKKFPDAPTFEFQGKLKLSAGWLLEQCGYKGKDINGIKVYDKNALVLTNPGGASFNNLEKTKDEIITAIKEKFGVTLEPEPLLVE